MQKVIFVHGCFWHRHPRCTLARLPKSRLEFWLPKLTSNRKRDKKILRKLRRLGWHVLVIWECEIAAPILLRERIFRFLEGHNAER
jgi:DNA mismatch endonuclease (patch repair protein)